MYIKNIYVKKQKQTPPQPYKSVQFVIPSISSYPIPFQVVVEKVPDFPKLIQYVFSAITYLFKSKVKGHSFQPLISSTDQLFLPRASDTSFSFK